MTPTEQLRLLGRIFDRLGLRPWACDNSHCCGGINIMDADGNRLFDTFEIDLKAKTISAQVLPSGEKLTLDYSNAIGEDSLTSEVTIEPLSCEIWREGYHVTGERSPHQFVGYGRGMTFQEACNDLADRCVGFREYYEPATRSYWGCKLFPTKAQAAVRFG